MEKSGLILLPGLEEQADLLLKRLDIKDFSVLIMGSSSEMIAERLSVYTRRLIELIVEDYESFINSNLLISGQNFINLRMMDFEFTDFEEDHFDLVFSQASVSNSRRNKIIKEIKRILKPGGYLYAGEIVRLQNEVPAFIRDIFARSDLDPLENTRTADYYSGRNFAVVFEEDLSHTLKDYYSLSAKKLDEAKHSYSEEEKKYYKKLLNKISHESKAYLSQGGNKYMGYKVLLLKKQ